MKKIFAWLFSMTVTGVLIVIFAVAIAYATFIENDYGTTTAKILIYSAWWFELLFALMAVNLIGSVFVNDLVSKKKWPVFLFHIAFVVIVIGAGITRYHGFEGTMHIREGSSANTILSTEAYVTVQVSKGDNFAERQQQVMFSQYTSNHFSETLTLNGQSLTIKNKQFVPSAAEQLVADPAGEPIVSVIALYAGMQRMDFILREGGSKKLGQGMLGFKSDDGADIQLKMENGALFFTAPDSVAISGIMQGQNAKVAPGTEIEINTQHVYTMGDLSFAVPRYFSKGKTQLAYVQPKNGAQANDALQLQISLGDQSKELIVFGKKGTLGEPYSTLINGVQVEISYGSKSIEIPFSIYLKDFQLERYPGSNSPSSYASEVVLKDGGTEQPFRIFMNNILKYGGYRFFQSSYDPDEKGTILSVNHDALGTSVTYFGYFIMGLGMLLTLFNKNSRFKKLVRKSSKLREKRKKLFALAVVAAISFSAAAQPASHKAQIDKQHLAEFETLVIQSSKGRVEPTNTLASEILRKVAKKTSWEGLSATEVFMGMQASPGLWQAEPIIKVANPELRKQLGVSSGKYVSFNQLVAPRQMGGYKLSAMVSAAYSKKPNERNKLDKEIINVDERVNILMNVFSGNFLTIFPVPGHDNHKWVSANESQALPDEVAQFAQQTISVYFAAVANRDWGSANRLLATLKSNQLQQGAKIIPSKAKIKLEVFYNNINIFGKLSKIFMFTGLLLLVVQLANLFKPTLKLGFVRKLAFIFILLLFVAETAGLAIRWYIAGHAPWSNGYESMIFISWATCLGGLIFAKRSEITLSLTTVLAGLTLLVAGMSWMSPEITNLVPVLQSYWLIVHVAIITASYGFLAIGALLGFLNLLLMVARRPKNRLRVNFTIDELSNITQIALLIGLLMLTVGSFLGGIWANESWGRYWGWDPKETWALVTILVYTFIGHMHKIPGLKGNFAVSVAALLGFSSVLMTYFGVNYYLSGLHSYAQGEPAPIPMGVYIAILLAFAVIVAAYFSDNKTTVKNPKSE